MAASAPSTGTHARRPCSALLSLILWALIIVVTLKYVLHAVAGRQQRRGWHALADGAGVACGGPGRQGGRDCRAPWHHRRCDVLWRCGHHAGALGAVCRRRHRSRPAGFPRIRRALDRGHSGRAVCLSVARHRASRCAVRPDHDALVHRHRRCWARARGGRPGRAMGAQSVLRPALSRASRTHRPRHARRGVPRRDRRARRSMPISVISAVGRSRSRGSLWCCRRCAINYLGQGALVLCPSRGDRESVLSAVSRTGRCLPWWCWRPSRP